MKDADSAPRPRLLLVDDGERYAELFRRFLGEYELTQAHDLAEARAALAGDGAFDAILLDVAFELPEARLAPSAERDLERRRRLQGLDILAALRRDRVTLPVVLMTSREELALEDAADAADGDERVTLAGGDAFDARAVGLLVERVLAAQQVAADAGHYLWGRSTAMARVRREALALARTSLPILLLGETGTGKSALAERVLHPATGRKGAFVAADLAALPPTLVAAELFGSARGAFSGAVDRAGLLEAADRGTLLLDEVGNLPLELQRMLLVCIESGRVTRLGEATPRAVDVKLIAATNADLPALVAAGQFRADLYARLNPTARLELPPLRARLADLEALIASFVERAFARGAERGLLAEYARRVGVGEPRVETAFGRPPAQLRAITFVVPRASLVALRAHPWRGNVRELALVVANAAIFALADADAAARRGRAASATAPRLIPMAARTIDALLAAGSAAPSGAPTVTLPFKSRASLKLVARDLERELYQQLFDALDGDFAAMARRLLGSATPAAARKVRLRFNQLGLRVRKS